MPIEVPAYVQTKNPELQPLRRRSHVAGRGTIQVVSRELLRAWDEYKSWSDIRGTNVNRP